MIGALERRRSQLPIFAVCVAVFAWGSGPLWVRAATVDSATFAFFRLWLATPVMWVVAYLTGGRFSWTTVRKAVPAGIFFGVSLVLGFTSFRETSIANATLIAALAPAVILLLAKRLFGDTVGPRLLVFAGVAFCGVVLVILAGPRGGASSLGGDLYAVGNLVTFAGYFMFGKQLRDEGVHAWTLIATIFMIAGVVVTPYCLVVSDGLGRSQAKDWLLYLGIIAGPGLLGHGVMTWAHQGVDISVSSVLTLANAPLSMVGAWVFFGQSLNLLQMVGVLIVIASLAAIALAQAPGRRALQVTETEVL